LALPLAPTRFPYTTLFRSRLHGAAGGVGLVARGPLVGEDGLAGELDGDDGRGALQRGDDALLYAAEVLAARHFLELGVGGDRVEDRKSTSELQSLRHLVCR